MRSAWFAVVSVVLLCTAPARADMGVPGFKFRELRVALDNLGDYPDYDLYLVAASWVVPGEPEPGPGRPNAPTRVRPGELHRPGYPARFVHNWLLVAVPRGGSEPGADVSWESLAPGAPGVVHSNRVQLSQPSSVILLNPTDYETRHFRVTLTDGHLTLTPGAVERGTNGFGSWLPGLVTTAALVGAGWLIVWCLRRGRQQPPPSTDAPGNAGPG